MNATSLILSDKSIDITDLKRNPMTVVDEGEGGAVAVLNRNKPIFYAVPPEAYEAMLEALEDAELATIVKARSHQPAIEVNLDDL